MSSREVVVGKITGVHGVRGYVRLLSYTSPPERIWEYAPFYISGEVCVMGLIGSSRGSFIVRIAGLEDRDRALSVVGSEVSVLRENFPVIDDDEYYYCDLIGLEVVSSGKKRLGRVMTVEDYGAGVIIVWSNLSGQEELHPYSDDFFGEVDLSKGEIEFLGE